MSYQRLDAYIEYLGFLQEKFDKFFANQKEYICCKKGCSLCCETGEYPLSEIEMHYLMNGFMRLDENIKSQIREKIKNLKERQKNSTEKPFLYDCPFLIDKQCSIYKFRPIICRVFGLPYYGINDTRVKLPFCTKEGLNYSQVYDFERDMISSELYKKSGIKNEPLSFNLSLKFILDNETVHKLGLNFGEERNLIDWFD